ncbi:MAG: fluoride efflux transporter CrcB [Usitatibacter sp.]
MLTSVVAISIGASLGALLRWVLGIQLNSLLPSIPLGTLSANLIGGYIIGVLVACFAARPEIPPQVRLFAITGFCGGLTTFSTFSAEVVDLLQKGDVTAGSLAIVAHVAGSLSMTLLGLVTWHWYASN